MADARVGTINNLDLGYPINPGAELHKLFGARRLGRIARMESIPVQLAKSYFSKTLSQTERS